MTARWLDWALPASVGVAVLLLWELGVDLGHIPPYILPGPIRVATKLVTDWGILGPALWFTFRATCLALLAAVIGGGVLAIVFAQSSLIERSLLPYAVILQVTPIVSVAPLLMIWVDSPLVALLICAWIAAFFPILSNTMVGLRSADRNLSALFQLYGASSWQRLVLLRMPSALPYFLTGLRISGGLALVGTVVSEFVAGAAGRETGLAYRILESQYRLDVARAFAGLVLISLTGILIYGVLSLVSYLLLRDWHESVLEQDE